MDVLYGIENPVFKDLKSDRDFIFKKLLPWLPKFIFTVGKINRMNMPVEDYLETIVKNNFTQGHHFTTFLQKYSCLFCNELFFIVSRLFLSQRRCGEIVGSFKKQNTRIWRGNKDRDKNY